MALLYSRSYQYPFLSPSPPPPPMRAAPRIPHVLFSALVLFAFTPAAEAQANRTVDDFSPQITYNPAADVTHDTTGFNVTKLYNGTIAVMTPTDTDPVVNMTIQFTGTAIWLFIGKPQTTDTFSDGYTVYLDGVEVDDVGDVDLQHAAEYGNVAYSNDALKLGSHTVTLAADSPVYFDYAVFTSNDPTPETTIGPVQPGTSSTASTGTGKSKSTSTNPAAQASQSGAAVKAKSHIAAIAGAAAAVLLLGAGIAAFLLLRRRKRSAAPSQQQFLPGGGYPGSYGGPSGPTQPVYNADPAAQTSQAALLRVPTLTPATSQYNSTPTSMPMPLPPTQPDPYSSRPNQYQPQPQSQPYSQYPPQSQYQPPPQNTPPPPPQSQYSPPPQAQSHYAPAPEPYFPHSSSQHENGQAQDPFAYIQPHDMARQRILAEQRAVEADTPPTAWAVDEREQPQPHIQLATQSAQPYYNYAPAQPESQHPPPREGRTLAYQRPQDAQLDRIMEKHREAEAEYYANAHTHGLAPTSTWPDENRGQGTQAMLDVQRNPSSSRGTPSRTHSATSSRPESVTYPPSPGGSSSAHGAAAISTIAAEMAALRAQVARLENERREELPPAYN
ncbi:hypothetical protein MSAN_01216800 [Mycena sanguinolenta]|uniref:Transmembrane protein n=1 Tax=Mycena sanguinolenta TaxID=230812 RepID=A0A8H6YI88_9AGAR|nr:hypothetical protein MSAN_01216800 [Mycena sanguinolenta]